MINYDVVALLCVALIFFSMGWVFNDLFKKESKK